MESQGSRVVANELTATTEKREVQGAENRRRAAGCVFVPPKSMLGFHPQSHVLMVWKGDLGRYLGADEVMRVGPP